VTAVDVLAVLKRTDGQFARRSGDDPAAPDYLRALADAVQPLLVNGKPAAAKPAVDDVQVKQLLADKERLEEVTAGLRRDLAARGKGTEAQAREIAELKAKLAAADEDTRRRIDAAVAAIKGTADAMAAKVDELRKALTLRTAELDDARAERDTARAQLRDRPAAGVDASILDQAQRDNARLADELAQTRHNLELANRTLDEIADEEAGRPASARHWHQFEVDPRTGEHHPCRCGQPWIRALVEDDEEIQPDIEPWAALFDRIRDELGEVAP